MDRQSREDWSRFDPCAIPTKSDVANLDAWLARCAPNGQARALDLGCGNGRVSQHLALRGLAVVGVDINADAIQLAQRESPTSKFYARDIAAVGGMDLPEPAFPFVVCQLVLSIIGDATDRAQVLRNAHAVMLPEGELFASFSGTSDDLNPEYARIYEADLAQTAEPGTYLSRDAAGRALYRTHHFTREEISALLQATGFSAIELDERIETSSRRPDQRARFFYATCRRL